MKAYKVLLTKIESSHTNLRTPTVEGLTLELPVVEKNFSLSAAPLTPGAIVRRIDTTAIQEVVQEGSVYTFRTLNSTYKVEVLGTEEVG